MKFTYKTPKLKKLKISNRRFRIWLEDEESEALTLYGDEINFSTMILNVASSSILKWTLGMGSLAAFMCLFAYPILKHEVKAALISELK